MDRTKTPKQTGGYESADLEGEFMLYHSALAKALYLNETASLIWKLCDGTRNVATIEGLLRDAYPDAPDLPRDIDDAFKTLVDHGVLELS
jgi:hypothetical protein